MNEQVNTTPAAPVTPAPVATPAPAVSAESLQALSGFEGLLGKSEEFKTIQESAKKVVNQPAAPVAQQPVKNQEVTDPAKADKDKTTPTTETKSEEPKPTEEEKEYSNPLLSHLNKTKTPSAPINSVEDFISTVNKDFGQDLKDLNDLPKFIEATKNWRSEATRAADFKTKADKWESFFQNIPEPLTEAIKAHYNNQDWRETISSATNALNYNKSFEEQLLPALESVYGKGKFTAEDLKEADEHTQKAIDVARSKFEIDKQAVQMKRAQSIQSEQAKRTAVANSIKSSVETLAKSFPGLTQYQNDIEQEMSGGGLAGLFYNPDGTFKPDAAERIALAKYGREAINELTQQASAKAKTEVTEEFVDRSRTEPTRTEGGGGGNTPANPLPPAVSRMLEGTIKQMTYS